MNTIKEEQFDGRLNGSVWRLDTLAVGARGTAGHSAVTSCFSGRKQRQATGHTQSKASS